MKILILFLLATMHFNSSAQHTYSKTDMAEDLDYLKKELERNHPNLFTYSTKEEINNWFNKQVSNLPNSISEKDAFEIVTSISPFIGDGHTYIYPSADHLDKFFGSAPLFPLDVFLMNDSLYVTGNYSKEQNIPKGAILTKINGDETKEIQPFIVQHTCRDGDNFEYPKHLFYQFFPAYYSYFYGYKENYEIEFIDEKGKNRKVSIQGLRRDQIKIKRSSKGDSGIDLHLTLDSKSALLTIKSFDKNNLKSDYKQNFKKEIKKAFKLIEANSIEFLAIDLRNNQGGELSNGIYLLQYFMNSEFQCVSNYYVLKNGVKKKLNSKWNNYFKPKTKNHFNGKVYLFINGGSFSCSSVVANTFKENKRGQIIGQMSGGSAYVNSGAPNEVITLPNTKIIFTIPKTQYILRKDLKDIKQGVTPDVEVLDNPNRIIENEDNYIEKFIELTKKN